MSVTRRPAFAPRPPAVDPGPAGPVYTPIRVVDIDLTRPYEFRPPAGPGPVRPAAPVLALVRLRGRPVGLVTAGGRPDGTPEDLWRSVAGTARRRFLLPRAGTPARGTSVVPPSISVIIATHNRPDMLRRCLDTLLRVEYQDFEVIVVDNAPADDTAERLVRDAYGDRVRYVLEPMAGLAHAHNRGLAAARGEIAAFTDDDTLVDPGWLAALAEGFAQDPGVGCVTGLIVPAELETAAQAALERHGGFAKGFAPRTWSLRHPPQDPLFPFTAGRFGSGTNMAFRTGTLRELGGFDPATGTGTPARGGDDLLAFFRVLTTGHTLAYQPGAIVWHRHRRTQDALDAQAFGYGAGLGAYLTGALARDPRMIPALLRRLPRGIRYAVAQTHRKAQADSARSRRLARLELRGLLYGPFGYLRSRRRNHAVRGPG
ncbi:GT2 family glycosyltransferase [Streptomyces luteogriseus]|uniref:GT2 family glycosyltransferase n=1 Tax=Streptomyces luteogriseus TaxID=68233 RepID=A0A7W7DHZ1_9ACTN|nr:glycosyltransferase [Streptomyces luteogriseus]MBB4711026.1 GT2 family glycosyltransferase [Streptomyces luteogriseus]